MTYEDDRDEGEIRRRAAWLLGMLAVVAALIAVLMVFFLRGGGSGGSGNNAAPDPNYGIDPSVSASSSGAPSGPAATDSSPDASSSASSGKSSGTSSGPPPDPSCPSDETCVVKGDIAATVSAINKLRAEHDLSPVQATINDDANQCAVTRGDDCPQSFVWVHVDDLSGQAVVSAVEGFHGTDNLLDGGAKKFAIGWAYDPSSKSAYCAVIRES